MSGNKDNKLVIVKPDIHRALRLKVVKLDLKIIDYLDQILRKLLKEELKQFE